MRFHIRQYLGAERILACLLIFVIAGSTSCTKLVQIPPPANTITTSQVFADSLDATAAIDGIYSSLISTQTSVGLGDGLLTLFCGLSSDEYEEILQNYQFLNYNDLTAEDGTTDQLWQNGYTYLYPVNSCIESVQASSGLSTAAKNQFIGEAKFLRALIYFYLVNLYGDVPLITGTSYQSNEVAPRASSTLVYQQIVSDLKDAQNLLLTDYSISGGERTRANQAAATALLARVYLYEGDWTDAAAQATAVIDNGSYKLIGNLDSVFLANSNEAILQWEINPTQYPYNATPEGVTLLPQEVGYPSIYYLTSSLLAAFEPGDQRYSSWVDSASFGGAMYYYPYKYKIGLPQVTAGAPATEYYMVLRLAEQYLIRAEAEANGATGGSSTAIADLNMIRGRAGLASLPNTLNSSQVLAAVAQERRIELFAEWGHRWFDLKRTNAIDSVMTIATPLKGGNTVWQSFQQSYPIPLGEIKADPNLHQNTGY